MRKVTGTRVRDSDTGTRDKGSERSGGRWSGGAGGREGGIIRARRTARVVGRPAACGVRGGRGDGGGRFFPPLSRQRATATGGGGAGRRRRRPRNERDARGRVDSMPKKTDARKRFRWVLSTWQNGRVEVGSTHKVGRTS